MSRILPEILSSAQTGIQLELARQNLSLTDMSFGAARDSRPQAANRTPLPLRSSLFEIKKARIKQAFSD